MCICVEGEVTVPFSSTFHIYCTCKQHNAEAHTLVQASSQPMAPFLFTCPVPASSTLGSAVPQHPLLKDQLHKEPKCFSTQTHHTLSVSLSCTRWAHCADSENSARGVSSRKYTHNTFKGWGHFSD